MRKWLPRRQAPGLPGAQNENGLPVHPQRAASSLRASGWGGTRCLWITYNQTLTYANSAGHAPQTKRLPSRPAAFSFPPRHADGPTARYMTHMFDMRCRESGIEHRLTKIKHPWTNGQVERMNRTIKEATVKRYHYARHQQLETHLTDFINAYNYGKRLKTLRGLTPYEFICKT